MTIKNRIIIAGADVAALLDAELAVLRRTGGLTYPESVYAWQKSASDRGFTQAQIVKSAFGWSVYAFGPKRSGVISAARNRKDKSLEAAIRVARDWAAKAPATRWATHTLV